MKVKELQKTVNVAWSPDDLYPIYLATGSAAQQLDSNGNSVLEIYGTNLNEPGYDLELKASLPSQYRFQKIIWSPTGHDGDHPNGLIVGGCEKGNIMVYSASKMLEKKEGLIARQDSHSGPVRGLDFNPFQTNLLASVASESEIFVWDLNNTATHMTPGTKTQPLEDVQNVAWNRQVQHILASVFSSRCVIWDLRKNEQIIKLSDTQSRVRWHAVQWHPDVATQIWLASEEDQAPVVQMWDLRYATAPAKTIQIHQRGVLGMSWCSKDSDMVVSCGKDNRIFCWNPNTNLPEGEILSEVAVTPQWYSDVQWCPRNPALIASSSLDGNVSIYSLFGGTQQQVQTSNKIADSFPGMDQLDQVPMPQPSHQITFSDPSKPPKWMKKQSGVKFAFGGKLLSFNSQSKSVQIQQIVSDQNIVERARNLENALADRNFIEFCRTKADEVNDQDSRYLWYFLKANFEIEPKEEILNLLGYNTEDISNKFSKYLKNENIKDNIDLITNQIGVLNQETGIHDHYSDSENNKNKDKIEKTTEPKDDLDGLISEAIITGNIEAAVELCFDTCRPADALVIASTLSIDFLTKTQERFLKKREGDLSKVISALISRDWMDFVSHCSIDSWKKALVAVLKHGDRKVVNICEKLGDRLLADNSQVEYTKSALLCYICACNVDKVIDAWHQLKRLEEKNAEYELNVTELQELAEIVMILSKSLEQQGIVVEPEGKFAELTFEYGSLLAAQGAISIAVAYVFAVGPSTHPQLNDLRDRLNKIINQKSNTEILSGPHSFSDKQANIASHPQGYLPNNISPPDQMQTGYNSGLSAVNQWNLPPPVGQLAGQSSHPVKMFNPQVQNSHNLNQLLPQTVAKPPSAAQINESLMHPPRPSSVSSQGSTSLTSRPKYILDPSVSSGPQYGSSNYSGSYNQIPGLSQTNFNNMPIPQNPTAYNSTPSQVHAMHNNYMQMNSMQTPQSNYLPGIAAMEPVSSIQQQNPIQRNPTPPPGWNDPPALKSNKQQIKKMEPSGSAITHPLFGIDPNQNGYLDPNAFYQNQVMPPQASINQLSPQMPYNVIQQNNNLQPTHSNFPTTPAANLTMYQQHTGYQELPAPVQQRVLETPLEKPTLPEEFIYMQTLFEELKTQCLAEASDPRTKRKFVDVTKRLETLYDCLRDGRLTTNTIEALNQIVQYIQIGDYGNALATHTSIAFGTDFAQTAGFMPGIKVLIQSAADLKVFLR
ncbi:protein transport protein Sec31A [Episyrphus balteatus]|uniref:protein transport protein Sec31A n=1 Tax=Episyrphus balteatus TaxID=286459 RepID=UPI00248643FC|nr:protein transport protein Sec31A [Episyrphus balteatus]